MSGIKLAPLRPVEAPRHVVEPRELSPRHHSVFLESSELQPRIEHGLDHLGEVVRPFEVDRLGHGPAAEGNVALNSPRLAGSDDWYMVAQLQAFRSGQRGTHPDDRTGRQMRAMAGVLPDDKAIADVVAFVNSLAQ